MLRIDSTLRTGSSVVYTMTGCLTADQMPQLEALVRNARGAGQEVTLDLGGVWLVAREVVAFFSSGAGREIQLLRPPAYLREWLKHEQREAE
jgi:hypothetical protein